LESYPRVASKRWGSLTERRAAYMADKVENMNWDELVHNYKLKDNGLLRAVGEYSELKTKEEFDGVLAKLATIAKLGTDLKNSKEAKAAGPDVIKRMSKLIDATVTSRKEWEKRKADQAKTGTRQDVQILLQAWNGHSMYGCVANAELSSAGGNTIQRKLSIGGTVLSIKDVYLKDKGALDLTVYRGSHLFCEGTAPFELKPGKPVVQFRFVQDTQTVKLKAKSIEEVSKKLGLKAEASLELKVLTVGGEATSESEYKQGYEQEVEWEIETGKEKFKESNQL
jgi:hypothetical protein